jgi:membrane-bound ClpP family serine protease
MSAEMRLDVRIPIGGMFSIIGMLLVVFGLVSDKDIYARSLNININLWWGLVMLVFGVVMLVLARRAMQEARKVAESGRKNPATGLAK